MTHRYTDEIHRRVAGQIGKCDTLLAISNSRKLILFVIMVSGKETPSNTILQGKVE